ncbi:FecR family protein [Phenylobacterium sp.]|jgi:transmembrane sensor|uniref:FecR family protein n=1 Tax=Phenylobacterium sp. TaxID=1871053 RepID=UPI002F954556
MIGSSAHDEARLEAACDWIVRLQAGDAGDALGFDAWLAEPANARAYDAALAVWTEYGANAAAVGEALRNRSVRAAPTRRAWFVGGAIAAALAAAAVILPQLQAADPAAQPFQTARAERRSVDLADGSRIYLNADTALTVTLAKDERRVTLDHGQAVFEVAADRNRPFVIAAGDRLVRVVGTQFDVRRRDGRLAVTVAEGVVEVRPVEGAKGSAFRLTRGERLEHQEGVAGARVVAAAPDEVLAWRSGRLVYRARPLSEVIADLNAHFDTPIRIEDAALAATPISGVLILDDQDAVIRRLALLVSAEPVRSGSGVVLRR